MNRNFKINSNAQGGFTLIELIVVIVILGILAATALPKFANLSGDARAASLQAAKGSLASVSAMAHGAFLVNPTGNASSVTMEGQAVAMVNQYPQGVAALANAAGLNVNGSTDYTISAASGVLTVSPVGVTTIANCSVVYTQAAAGGVPQITMPTAANLNCN